MRERRVVPARLVSREIEDYLQALRGRVLSVFGEQLAGLWLLGSTAYGGFIPTSDLDVQAATTRQPTSGELARLVRLISQDQLPCPAARLEFVLYERAVLADATPPLQWSLNLNTGPSRPLSVSTDPTTESWHWFVLDLAIGRELAISLHGAELADVAGPISPELLVSAIAESVRWHLRHDRDGPNRVANAARGLRYTETGKWGSKPAALDWLAATGRSPEEAVRLLEDRFGVGGHT